MKYIIQILFICGNVLFSQEHFGSFASAIYMDVRGHKSFYSCTGSGMDKIDATNFSGNLGNFQRQSGTLSIAGAEIKTWNHSDAKVCGGTLFYIIYEVGKRPTNPKFSFFDLPLESNCTWFGNFENSEGRCNKRDKKWKLDNKNIDLTRLCPNNYTLEIYYSIRGSNFDENKCDTTKIINNSGKNFKMNFTITPNLSINAYTLTPIAIEGQDVQLHVTPTHPSDTFNYVWKGNNFLSKERNPIIKNVKINHSGSYKVEVTNSCGNSVTSEVILKVMSLSKKQSTSVGIENKTLSPKKSKENKPTPTKTPTQPQKPITKTIESKQPEINQKTTEPIKNNSQEILEKKESRSSKLVEKFKYSNSKLKLLVYDYGEEDGDLLTIFHNDKIIASKIEVTKQGKIIELGLDKNTSKNEIVFVAENMGTIPPNTSKVDIYIDGKIYSFRVSTDNSSNAKFEFEKR